MRIFAPLLGLILCSASCAAKDGRAPVGVSQAKPTARAANADAGTGLPPAAWRDYRTAFSRVSRTRFMSRGGHSQDRFAVEVWANAAARAPGDTGFAVGATFVKEQYERTGEGDRLHSWAVMEKKEKGFDPDHGDWRYSLVKTSGEPGADGRIELCRGCHAMADRDHVFRILD